MIQHYRLGGGISESDYAAWMARLHAQREKRRQEREAFRAWLRQRAQGETR